MLGFALDASSGVRLDRRIAVWRSRLVASLFGRHEYTLCCFATSQVQQERYQVARAAIRAGSLFILCRARQRSTLRLPTGGQKADHGFRNKNHSRFWAAEAWQ